MACLRVERTQGAADLFQVIRLDSLKTLLLLLAMGSPALASDLWLARVAPVINGEERKLYLSLKDEAARVQFRDAFWNDKAIDGTEYFRRLEVIDNQFGSGAPGSGA